jgi:hypothetical protein
MSFSSPYLLIGLFSFIEDQVKIFKSLRDFIKNLVDQGKVKDDRFYLSFICNDGILKGNLMIFDDYLNKILLASETFHKRERSRNLYDSKKLTCWADYQEEEGDAEILEDEGILEEHLWKIKLTEEEKRKINIYFLAKKQVGYTKDIFIPRFICWSPGFFTSKKKTSGRDLKFYNHVLFSEIPSYFTDKDAESLKNFFRTLVPGETKSFICSRKKDIQTEVVLPLHFFERKENRFYNIFSANDSLSIEFSFIFKYIPMPLLRSENTRQVAFYKLEQDFLVYLNGNEGEVLESSSVEFLELKTASVLTNSKKFNHLFFGKNKEGKEPYFLSNFKVSKKALIPFGEFFKKHLKREEILFV